MEGGGSPVSFIGACQTFPSADFSRTKLPRVTQSSYRSSGGHCALELRISARSNGAIAAGQSDLDQPVGRLAHCCGAQRCVRQAAINRSAECYVRKCRSRRRVPNGHPPAEVAAIPAVARRHRQAIPEPGRGQASIQESLADATVQKEAQSDIEMQTDRTAKTQFFMKGPANPAAGVTAVRRGPVPSAGVPA
jgi:hypothetical protein